MTHSAAQSARLDPAGYGCQLPEPVGLYLASGVGYGQQPEPLAHAPPLLEYVWQAVLQPAAPQACMHPPLKVSKSQQLPAKATCDGGGGGDDGDGGIATENIALFCVEVTLAPPWHLPLSVLMRQHA